MRKVYSHLLTCAILISTSNMSANDTPNGTVLDEEFRLKENLLSPVRYNPIVRPKRNHSEPLVIFITWTVIALINVSERDSTLCHAAATTIEWTDEYLTWNPDDYGGLNQTYVTGKYIWTPKLMGSNAIGSNFLDNILDDAYRITSSGVVSILTSGVLSVSCVMNPENFPFDCQTCDVKLNYGIEAKGYIQFKVPDNFKSTFPTYRSHVWNLVSTSLEVPNNSIGTALDFEIVLKRKPTYYLFIIIVPSVILCIVTVAVYFIPAEEGEKIGCCMTILLTFMVSQTQMSDHLPENSDVAPIIGLYFILIMASCSLVTIDSIIMSNYTPTSDITNGNDPVEGDQKREETGFVGIKKRTLRLNRWSLCHYTFGGISFLLIAVAQVLLLEKSFSASCDS